MGVLQDNLVSSTELTMQIGHHKEIRKLTFRALALSRVWHIRFAPTKGLTLETSAFDSLYGGQFTSSTQLIKPNYLIIIWILEQDCPMLLSLSVPVHTTELLCRACNTAQAVYQPSRTISNRMKRLHWKTTKKQVNRSKPQDNGVTKCHKKDKAMLLVLSTSF